MTPTDDVRAWRDAMPRRAIAQLHDTQAVVALITKATSEQGWTVAQLVAECSRDLHAANAGALITYRLRRCADTPPPQGSGLTVTPLCGNCTDGFLLDPVTLLPTQRCPCRNREGATA